MGQFESRGRLFSRKQPEGHHPDSSGSPGYPKTLAGGELAARRPEPCEPAFWLGEGLKDGWPALPVIGHKRQKHHEDGRDAEAESSDS